MLLALDQQGHVEFRLVLPQQRPRELIERPATDEAPDDEPGNSLRHAHLPGPIDEECSDSAPQDSQQRRTPSRRPATRLTTAPQGSQAIAKWTELVHGKFTNLR